jgi:Family of unknown function (DUF6085)
MSDINTGHWTWNRWACPEVQGTCQACGLTALFLGHGGWVTCANLSCPDPDAADKLLHARKSTSDE